MLRARVSDERTGRLDLCTMLLLTKEVAHAIVYHRRGNRLPLRPVRLLRASGGRRVPFASRTYDQATRMALQI